jgi:integrase
VKLGRFRKNDPEARKALDKFAEQHTAALAHAKAYTVGELWKIWLAEREKDGFCNYIYGCQWASMEPVFGHRRPDSLTPDDFRQYAKARFGLGRSAWTVHNELVRLRTCLKWALENRKITLLVKVWVPSQGGHRERVLTLEEARALVAASKESDPHIHIFIVIAFGTAARHTAILDLEWDRVDWIKGLIEFDEGGELDPMSKSWKKGRATVPMNRAVRAALQVAYAGRQSDYVIEHGGRRLTTVRDGFRNAVERAAKVCPTLGRWEERKGKDGNVERVFVTDVTPHIIRHTVLTWLDQAVPDARRAKLAGHADEDITKKVYTHATPEVLQEAVDRLNDALQGEPVSLPALTKGANRGPSAGAKAGAKSGANPLDLSRMDKPQISSGVVWFGENY